MLAWMIFKSGNSKHSSSCPSVDTDCRQLFLPLNNRRYGKEKASLGPRGFLLFFFFFNLSSFRSNLHLRGRETVLCCHSISLKFKNSWGYFSWFIKFTSFQRNLPADLSLPQQLGLPDWVLPAWSAVRGWVCDLSRCNILFEGEREGEKNWGIEMNLSSPCFPFWR